MSKETKMVLEGKQKGGTEKKKKEKGEYRKQR
jgi:hypothetical protein